MRIFEKTPALRWAVPMVSAVALVVGGSAIGGLHAVADDGLPARSAAQLLVDVQHARLGGLSGTVVQESDLGLPSLPGLGGTSSTASSDLTSLVSGTHTMRIWVAGPDKARIALLGSLGESDVIYNGQNLWVWASKDRSAKHSLLPAHAAVKGKSIASVPGSADVPTSPQAAAEEALAAISPSTKVTTSAIATVAGRPAYELVLKPKEGSSLVRQVRIAIDGTEHVPLRVQVFAKSVADPVFEVGFSSVDFGRPDAAQFTFNPPPGTTVTDQKAAPRVRAAAGAKTRPVAQTKLADMPKVIGQGWSAVVVVKVNGPTGTTSVAGSTTDKTVARLMRYVAMLPKVSGTWGSGHLMRGAVFSALLTDDGRLVVGAVTPKGPGGLYAALAAK